MKSKILLGFFVAALTVGLISGLNAATGEVLVIANKTVATDTLSLDEVKNIFLGKKTKWSDGKKVHFVTRKKSEVHKIFLKKYVSKTTSQFRNYWKKQVFTGKGRSPKVFKNDAEMISFVASTEGAIGYISAGSSTDTVKVIADK